MKTLANTLATLACTLVMSATLVIGAVGPAQADGNVRAVASTARIVA